MKNENGCDEASGCMSTEQMDDFGFPCQAICQPSCSSDEKFCPGIEDAEGCYTLGKCVKNVNIGNDGAMCLPICPVNCSKSQILCPGDLDSKGCQTEAYCVEKGISSQMFSNYFVLFVKPSL